ncbi:MAG: hypothetical protein IJ187_03640 [Neisseriaceae bacterium]|nr:hypothetical protein [Neisseriaceae bacterium]
MKNKMTDKEIFCLFQNIVIVEQNKKKELRVKDTKSRLYNDYKKVYGHYFVEYNKMDGWKSRYYGMIIFDTDYLDCIIKIAYYILLARYENIDFSSVVSFDEFERVVSEEYKNKKFEITYKKTIVYTNTTFDRVPQGYVPHYENVDFLYFSIKFKINGCNQAA